MERTHRLRSDLAWVPAKVRRTSRLIRGATWTTIGAAVVGTLAIAPPLAALLWKGALVGGAGAIAVSDGIARSVMRKRLAKMTRGELALADLDAREEGELVVVRGAIEEADTLHGLLTATQGVFRRMIFKARGTWVHEAAVDFTLVDDHGDRIRIEAAGARWMTPSRELVTYPGSRFTGEHVPARVQRLAAGKNTVDAIERVLTAGTSVQLVGYKTTSADTHGVVRDYRLAPQRATLRSGPELPLVISRLDELT